MRYLLRALTFLLLAVGLARAACYLAYAWVVLPTPLEAFHLESKMVLLAYRVEAGLRLYPDWENYPHVANFFAPVYFLTVGWLGRASGADLRGLFLIGRGVSFGSGLLTSAVLGAWAGRRYGRGAGWAAALVSLGVRPMDGFSVMTRPDMTAELFGVAGFALSGARSGAWRAAGLGLLVLAAFTKQTTAVYLLAAALATAAEGRRGRALAFLVAGGAAAAVVVGLVMLTAEPNFARSLLGESKTPWDVRAWLLLLRRMALGSTDLLVIPPLGLWLWTRGRTRDTRLAVLAAVLLAVSLVTSMKRGADLNYFLSLRVVEALAVAALWAAARGADTRRRSLAVAAALALGTVSLAQSALMSGLQAELVWGVASRFEGPEGRAFLGVHRAILKGASDPNIRLLTDSGIIDLYQKERAVFGDPWLFRVLVETGRIHPGVLIGRIDAGYYDTIITTSDFQQPGYATYEFGLPMVLIERARGRYELVARAGGLFLYSRRGEPSGTSTTGRPAAVQAPRPPSSAAAR